jgi:N-acetylmuramoyl-L-alanine amidase
MNKKVALLLLFALTITAAFTQPAPKKPISTLIIDPGHGGLDPGAKGTFAKEAQVSLEVSLRLGDTIAKTYPDIKILYTRTTDVLPGNMPNKDAALKYRANLANDNNGDLFISVHCNSSGQPAGGWYERKVVNKIPHTRTVKKGKKTYNQTYYEYEYENVFVPNKAKGTETYVWAVNKNESKMNHIQKFEHDGELDSTSTLTLPDPNDPAEKARMLIYAQNYFRKSINLASYVQEEFTATGRVDRGVKQRNDKGIWVLQATAMPSILIEIGFITNKEEEEYIASEEGQKEIVANIFTAFKKYKEKLEEKQKEKDKDKEEKKAF